MTRSDATFLVRLPVNCSIGAARAVHGLVQTALRSSAQVELDCSDVTTADVTSLQIVLSAARSARTDGHRVALRAMSAPLTNTFDRAGFAVAALTSPANGRA